MGAEKIHYAVVDEIEESTYVVLFDEGPKLHLSGNFLPAGTKEGSVLKITIELDEAEKERRIAKIQDLQTKLLDRTRGRKYLITGVMQVGVE